MGKSNWSFLWLLGNYIEIYTSVDKNNKEIGQIIYEDNLKKRIYKKEIYAQIIKEAHKNENTEDDKDENKIMPGFNANLQLNKDRNYIQNFYELKSIIA